MTNKNNIPIRYNMDLTTTKSSKHPHTIDLCPYFEPKQEEIVEDITEESDINLNEYKHSKTFTPEIIVSQSRIVDDRNRLLQQKKKEERKELLTWKYWIFRLFLFVMKKILIFSILLYQKFDNKLRAIEWWGINFDRKYSEKTIFYLSISLPETVKNVDDILIYFPLISRKLAYRMLKIRREQLWMYNEVFNKK